MSLRKIIKQEHEDAFLDEGFVSESYKSSGVQSQKIWHIAARNNKKPKVVIVKRLY